MKSTNFLVLLFSFLGILLLNSCKEKSLCDGVECLNGGMCLDGTCNCPTGFSGTNCETEDLCVTQNLVCENGGTCLNGICECPDGYIGDNCENFDPSEVQILLDAGLSPIALVNEGVPLDSLYGKIYEGGFIFYLNPSDGTGLVAATEDISPGKNWGCDGTLVNAMGLEIGTGNQNTLNILGTCMGRNRSLSPSLSPNFCQVFHHNFPSTR